MATLLFIKLSSSICGFKANFVLLHIVKIQEFVIVDLRI